FLAQQQKGLVYVLKGAIAPSILHESHWYASRGDRAHVIYMEGNTISIHDSPVTDPKKQMAGVLAKLVVVTQIGTSVFQLEGEMPKGEPARHRNEGQTKRAPVQSVLDAIMLADFGPKYQQSFFVGGGDSAGCLPCELAGGALSLLDRYRIMMTLRDGDDKYGIPAFKDKWAEFFVPSFVLFLTKGVSKNVEPGLVETIKAILTGNLEVDALLLLEPMAASPHREGEPLPSTHRYLIPDPIIEEWATWLKASPAQVNQLAASFRKDLNEMLNKGTTAEFTAARTAYIAHMRKDLAKVTDDKARSDFIKSSIGEIKRIYSLIGEKNVFVGADGKPIQAFTDKAYDFLHARYGDKLGSYLTWAMLVFFYADSLALDGLSKFDHIAMIVPGRDFGSEVAGALTGGASLDVAFATVAGLIEGGYLGYMRSSLDALAGRSIIYGGGFSHIDTAFRSFEALPRVDEVAAAKKKKHRVTKKKLLSLAKQMAEVGLDESDRKKMATEFSALKKKAKRTTLKKKIRRMVGGGEMTEAMKRRITSLDIKLKKSKAKKKLSRAKAEEQAELMKEIASLRQARAEEMAARGKKKVPKKKAVVAAAAPTTKKSPSLADLL
ncbi:MAG: hypothetical protein WC483_01020, partial [Candidatus Paceibacterota bacterium]